jgi:lysyl-tRNA synthetase class 1
VHHVHQGRPPELTLPISFSLLLNLVGAAGTADKEVVWGFVEKYLDKVHEGPTDHLAAAIDRLIGHAIVYFNDFIAPSLERRPPTSDEAVALRALHDRLSEVSAYDPVEIQNLVYEIGKTHGFENLRDWFKALYETLLGTSHGPRMGSFIALYGIDASRAMIAEALERQPALT